MLEINNFSLFKKNNMKTLKVKSILFSLLAMMAVAAFMTSCERQSIVEDDLQGWKTSPLDNVDESSELDSDKTTIIEKSETDISILEKGGCDPCGCSGIYIDYLNARSNCVIRGGYYCKIADAKYSQYINCLSSTPTCPSNYIFDGCNCYSQIHYPDGYEPFTFGNAFYVAQNCSISSNNNCCPPGFQFDGANCWSGHYFYQDGEFANIEGFGWGGAFFTTAGPCN